MSRTRLFILFLLFSIIFNEKCLSNSGFDEINKPSVLIKSCIGFTMGSPGGMNLSFSRYFDSGSGVRAAIGGISQLFGDYVLGGEIGYIKKLYESNSSLFSGCFDVGYVAFVESDRPYDYWNFVAVNAVIKYHSVYSELGLSLGQGDLSNPQILFQIGFIFHTSRYDYKGKDVD
ncbi:MAG: hypothetical protein ACOYVF_06780 [Candidatus Zixiibacteriota bacterium]